MDDFRYYTRRDPCTGHTPELRDGDDDSHVLYEEEIEGTYEDTISIVRCGDLERVEVVLREEGPYFGLWTFRYTTNPSEWPSDWPFDGALIICQLERATWCPGCERWIGFAAPLQMTFVRPDIWDTLGFTVRDMLGPRTADRVVQMLLFTTPPPPDPFT
jgi:hypothetical protein